MADQCWATCGCEACLKTATCTALSSSEIAIRFPEGLDDNDEKYSYAKYTGEGLQDDITQGVTICIDVTPNFNPNQNTLFPIFDYAVSPASYSNDYSNTDVQRDLRKISVEYSRFGIFLTINNQRKNMGVIQGAPNLLLQDNTRSKICMSYSLETHQGLLFKDGQQGTAHQFDPEVRKLEGNGILVIGQDQRRMEGLFDGNRAFKGVVSDLRIYKRPIASATLQAATSLANGQFPADAEVDLNTDTLKLFKGAVLDVNQQ